MGIKQQQIDLFAKEHPRKYANMVKRVQAELLQRVSRVSAYHGKALWRQVEEMSPEERLKVLPLNLLSPYGTVLHTKYYIKVRTSFVSSVVWKNFRRSFLVTHSKCERCRKVATVVHHRSLYTVDRTIIAEGLLESLKHLERFEALCQDCHYDEHEDMIENEHG